MTPPPIDPGFRGDEALRLAAGRETPPEATIRFADLLAREDGGASGSGGPAFPPAPAPAPAPAPTRSPADPMPETAEQNATPNAPAAHARLFNQDGFFGRPNAIASIANASPATASEAPVAATAAVAAKADAVTTPGMTAPRVPASAAPFAAAFAGAMTRGQVTMATSSTQRVPTPVAGPARAALRPWDPVGPRVRPAAARPIPPRPQQPAASVAVAVHAAMRGIEVAAQVAGLDERDRAALADEIAALLSAHGYPPAHVSVIAAAARGSRQDHR